ncbi:MAG: single-stranded-DNA-specific exonuclease RecJ [Ardenticatenaceae bacterium]|nr:single-stranded-DNA-specific exonuclease RecJ [Ardenticatenaceae bacterium]
MERFWTIRPKAPQEQFARLPDLERLVVQVLYNRGLTDSTAVRTFLDRRTHGGDPFQMQGIPAAVKRIRQAIERQERIIVHGDFDADGVTSTALTVEVLHALGARVAPYIPDRVDEGYGLNMVTLDKMAAQGVSLLVTVDCGIRAHNEIAHAARLGLDVIVTDHHSLPPTLPGALAIINPKQPGDRYGFADFAGVGLAFKLGQALVLASQERTIGRPRAEIDPDDLLDLVALGTVADLAPLLGENRLLVSKGLPYLNQPARPGLRHLMTTARVKPGSVNAETIGFLLGPRLNAAGRLDHAKLAYKLLWTRNELEAAELARQLEALNRRRQALTHSALEEARARLTDPNAPLLMVRDGRFPEGIIGLVAGRLTEEFYRPAVVVHQGPPDGESRGSARSIPELHIIQALDRCADLLVKYGGHTAAAGFTVATTDLPALEARLTDLAAASLAGRDLRPTLVADAEIKLEHIQERHIAAIETLAPFGEGNPEPLFAARYLETRRARRVGEGGKHLQLQILDRRRRLWQAIAFRQGERLAQGPLPELIDALFHLRCEQWNGTQRLTLVVQDLRASQSP